MTKEIEAMESDLSVIRSIRESLASKQVYFNQIADVKDAIMDKLAEINGLVEIGLDLPHPQDIDAPERLLEFRDIMEAAVHDSCITGIAHMSTEERESQLRSQHEEDLGGRDEKL